MEMEWSVRIAIIASGMFLWLGMLTGVWKYLQIRKSPKFRAHYYIDIAHRAALMYAFACLILAVLAFFSLWSSVINVILVLGNIIFFLAAIISYIVHGWLKDTSNQLQVPHQLGSTHVPKPLMTLFMYSLVTVELGCTLFLLIGAIIPLLN